MPRRAEARPSPRFVVAGGGTSTAAVRKLGMDALEMAAPLVPGHDVRELVLKGGRIGGPDCFLHARDRRVA